jgi:dihydroflavonol-4-reductase
VRFCSSCYCKDAIAAAVRIILDHRQGEHLNVLISGATGLVGSYLARYLLRRGDNVRILARTPARAAALRDAGASVHRGDLESPAGLAGIAEGVHAVFDLESAMRGPVAGLQTVDIQGTEWLLAESQRAGVARFVSAGTLAAYLPNATRAGSVIDERTPVDDSGLLGEYARAKAYCERKVLAASVAGKFECVIVRLGGCAASGRSSSRHMSAWC